MTDIDVVLLLLTVVIALTLIARRLAISAPIVLVLGGLLLSQVPGLAKFTIPPELVFVVFLPPLLYSAGYFTSIRDFKANLRPIVLLAFGLVLFTVAVVGVVAHALVPTLGWAGAFALGAIVAPPDAVAATSIFQRLGVPRRVVTVLEGESLMNDATALVAYRFAVAAALAGSFSLLDAGAAFVVVLAGGLAVGLVIGTIADRLVPRISDTSVLVAITLLVPYAMWLAAESIGVSGVLAVVIGGLYGRHAMRHASSDARGVANGAWQILLFVLNGFVFVLIGLQLPNVVRAVIAESGEPTESALRVITIAFVVTLVVIVARVVWVYPASYLPRFLIPKVRARDPYPGWRNVAVVAFSGLRGVVSLAAALSLPLDFPERELIVFVTFVVILATLVGQGLTLPWLVRLLGVVRADSTGHDEAHARVLIAEAALSRIPDLETQWPGHKPLIDVLRAQYEHRTTHLESEHSDEPGAAEQETLEHANIRRELIDAERRAALDLHGRGVISEEILRRLERDLDLEELRMEA